MLRQSERIVAGMVLALALIGAVGLPSGAQAAPDRQLTGGQLQMLVPVIGTLDASKPQETYTVVFNEGQIFSLTALNRSGDLELSLTVLDVGGQTLVVSQALGTDATFVVIEAVIAPVTGTYSVIIERIGNTAGEYSLLLLPGFSGLDKYDDFETTGDSLALTWEPYSGESVFSQVVNGALQIRVTTDNMLGYITPEDELTWSDLYIEADIQIEGSPTYYEYGFVLRLPEEVEEFYALTFSSDSDWSWYYLKDEWTPIQEWTVSPVIDGANKNPRVGVLIQGSTVRVYFNDQFVGEATDLNNFLTEGGIALVAATGVDQTDPVTVYFDNLVITTPLLAAPSSTGGGQGGLDVSGLFGGATPAAGAGTEPTPTSGLPFDMTGSGTKTPIPAQPTPKPTSPPLPTATRVPLPTSTPPMVTGESLTSWNSNRPSDVIAELQRLGLVPSGGSMAMNVPQSFGDTSASGFNFYPLGQGRTFRNFVLAFNPHLDITGPESGCGMHFRNNANSWSLAMVMEDGSAILSQVNNGDFHPASFFDYDPVIQAGQGAVNWVIVVAVEADMRMYINGQLVAAGTFTTQSGTVALEVYVAEDDFGGTQRTYCELDNIWLWEF